MICLLGSTESLFAGMDTLGICLPIVYLSMQFVHVLGEAGKSVTVIRVKRGVQE